MSAWPDVCLYLDDERPCPPGWTLAKTAAEAINILCGGRVTHVSLDHDLGPAEAGTGYDVMVWLEEQAHTNPAFEVPSISIHTANPGARVKMIAALGSIRMARA